MNKTKKILIIIAIAFSFVDVAWQIYNIVNYFLIDPALRSPVFYLVLDFITLAECIAVAVLLIMTIWQNGKLFRQRYGLYMTAIMISLIINLFSITSILLIATMFISDWVWIKQAQPKEENVIIINEPSREEKIATLRKQRERGEISEEEFQEKLLELL